MVIDKDEDAKKQYNDAVGKLFRGETWEERAEAAITLGHLKEKRATHLLARALNKENDPAVINRIIEAMGNIKDPKATMLIVDFLKKEVEKEESEQDKKRLFIILESLMKIGDKRALEHLGVLLDSCHVDVREKTADAFECIDPNWKENIKKSKS